MSHLSSRLLQVVGIALIVFGVLLVAWGLLPIRYVGPNPDWIDFALGVGVCILGWLLRRIAVRRLRRASLPKTDTI
jgi:hypothetical protein